MRAEHLTLERTEASASRTVQVHVPLPSGGSVPAIVIREVNLTARRARPLRSWLSGSLSKLVVFEQKYRWYRARGYGRVQAREKAWWHARAAPCPFAGL